MLLLKDGFDDFFADRAYEILLAAIGVGGEKAVVILLWNNRLKQTVAVATMKRSIVVLFQERYTVKVYDTGVTCNLGVLVVSCYKLLYSRLSSLVARRSSARAA